VSAHLDALRIRWYTKDMDSHDDNTETDGSLADDILQSLREAIAYARGEAREGTVVVHQIDTSEPADAESGDS